MCSGTSAEYVWQMSCPASSTLSLINYAGLLVRVIKHTVDVIQLGWQTDVFCACTV